MNNNKILEKDNYQTARYGGKEVCIKVVSLRTETLYKAGAMGKGYWRMSGNGIVQIALNNAWLKEQGVPDMRAKWVALHYPDQVQEV